MQHPVSASCHTVQGSFFSSVSDILSVSICKALWLPNCPSWYRVIQKSLWKHAMGGARDCVTLTTTLLQPVVPWRRAVLMPTGTSETPCTSRPTVIPSTWVRLLYPRCTVKASGPCNTGGCPIRNFVETFWVVFGLETCGKAGTTLSLQIHSLHIHFMHSWIWRTVCEYVCTAC
jgi:hypothetical protein